MDTFDNDFCHRVHASCKLLRAWRKHTIAPTFDNEWRVAAAVKTELAHSTTCISMWAHTRNRSQANGKIQIRCRRSFLNAPLRRQSSGAFKYLFYTRSANSTCSCTLSHNKVETTTAIHCWSRPEEGRLEPNPTRAICPGIQGFSQFQTP